MKKSILAIGLLSLVMVLTSFTTMETSKVLSNSNTALAASGSGGPIGGVKLDASGSGGAIGGVKLDASGSGGPIGGVKLD